MYNFFKCPQCGQVISLPSCTCGYIAENKNRIYQLTNTPYIVKEDSADVKYIGYEDIGEVYSGKSLFEKINIDEMYKKTAEIIGDGILLDLACGDGLFSVPLVAQNISVISMDISNKMLSLIYKRAEIADIKSNRFILCRANALDIPLVDCSVDAVIANSMLHLISKPENVVKEIHRVLKKGGKYITFDDSPGSGNSENNDFTEEETANNQKESEYIGFIHRRYFEILKSEYNKNATRYSWKFDRDKICSEFFDEKQTYIVENKRMKIKKTMKDSSLYRMSGKGFSDQSDVPFDVHKTVFEAVMKEYTSKYGAETLETTVTYYDRFHTTDITVYTK